MAKRGKKKAVTQRVKRPKLFPCEDCGKKCKTPSGLSSHRRSAHPEDPDDPTPKKVKFLESMCETGNVTLAAQEAGVCRQMPYEWAQTDELFAKAWAEAKDHAADLLEEEARRRAVTGVAEPVFQGGKKVGHKQRFSDTLLIFLLNGLRPEKYRRHNSHEHTGKGGGPIQTEPADPKEDLSPEELEKLRKLASETGVS